MIRVLQVVTYMGRGGLETMLMNYYRHIDRNKVQFDFLVHRDFEADYDKEILSMGGKIYRVSRLIPWSRGYREELKRFFRAHPEYKIVHVHQDCLSSVALQCAKECGVPVRIAHSHNSNQDRNMLREYDVLLDGEHGTIGCPMLNTSALVKRGLVQDGSKQIIDDAVIYPAQCFNPYDDPTGCLNMTDETYSIHWFAKSWMDKKTVMRSRLLKPIHRMFGTEIFRKGK